MNDKAHANHPSGTQDGENRISRDRRCGVKWMESNTAAVGVVNRVGEQMIEVYQHCGEHDERGSAPLFAEEEPRYGPGHSGVKNEMDNRRERHCIDFTHRFTAASAPGCWRGARLRRLMDDARNEIAVELSLASKRFQKLSA